MIAFTFAAWPFCRYCGDKVIGPHGACSLCWGLLAPERRRAIEAAEARAVVAEYVAGGQGRTSDDVVRSARWFAVALLIAVGIALTLIAWHVGTSPTAVR